jgi:hypothetical protein
MTTADTHTSDLVKEVQPPNKGTLSSTPFNDERVESEAPGRYHDSAAPGLSGMVKQCLPP